MGHLEAGFRRAPGPQPPPSEGEPRLVARIQDEIDRAGPITFARFMELALYEPGLGYYRVATARPGRAGDFLTAPETHPIFGAALARQLDEIHRRLGRPGRFVVREYGAGGGVLGLTILQALTAAEPFGRVAGSAELIGAIRYAPIELNEHRRAELVSELTAAGFGAHLEPNLAPETPEVGVVVANEFLDALPVHRVVGRTGGLRELFVGRVGNAFVEVEGESSTPALAARLAAEGVVLGEGSRAEVCLELDGWGDVVAAGLVRGVAIVIDYGHPAAELYGPDRSTGTLRAYAAHHVHDDWARSVGRQDLTAHVDFSALEAAARAAGLEPLGLTSQAEFLMGAGLDELLEAIRSDPATTMEAWLETRSGIRRLLDPRGLGGFRVAILGRGVEAEPPLRGLAYRLRRPA